MSLSILDLDFDHPSGLSRKKRIEEARRQRLALEHKAQEAEREAQEALVAQEAAKREKEEKKRLKKEKKRWWQC